MKKIKFIMIIALVTIFSNFKTISIYAEGLTKVKIGASPNVVEVVSSMSGSLEELGYELEVVSFDDIVLPNVALEEGSIDANLFQHEPFLNNYNQEHNTELYYTEPLFGGYTALYSTKHDDIESIPENGKIGIFDDLSNQHRALILAQDEGLITLKEKDTKKEGLFNIHDIEDNFKNIEFIPLQTTVLVSSVDDLDATFSQGTTMFLDDRDPEDFLAKEKDSSEYGMGLVVRPEDKDEQWVADIIAAFKTEETRKKIEEEYKGCYAFFD